MAKILVMPSVNLYEWRLIEGIVTREYSESDGCMVYYAAGERFTEDIVKVLEGEIA